MANKGVLSKNYYIDSVVVADFGTNIYNMMAEADQAMAEASEVIAEIASLTERVPSHIRCGDLLEACASAQAEIKSVDFLSYGQKVDQGLQNLLDHNQYITEHFIKNMGTHMEKMRGMGEEFRRLTDLITYSGEGLQPKGIKLSADGNAEAENTDDTERNYYIQGQDDILESLTLNYSGKLNPERQIGIRLLDIHIYYGFKVTGVEERKEIIQTILENEPYIFDNLYILNERSTTDYKKYIFAKSVDIQQYVFLATVNMQKLDEQGLLYLFEDEIGPRESWELYDYLRLDEDGNIIAIKVQDHNDGGYTIGNGIFISEDYPDRIELAESLGIDWGNTDEWVTIENVNIMFSEISPDYDTDTKFVEKNTGVLFTPVQYAAVYDLLYLRPFLKKYFVDLINENADRDVWITTLKDAIRNQAGEENWAKFGDGWTARIERSVNSYFDGVYYPKK